MSHLSNASMFESVSLWVVLGIAVLGLLYALLLRAQVMRHDKGTAEMKVVWDAIREGADAYLGRQLKTIIPLIVVLTAVLFLSVYVVAPSAAASARFPTATESQVRLYVGIARAVAFVMGAIFSLLVGQFGMRMAVQGNVRVAAAARTSFAEALKIAYRTGTITGMLTDGLGLLGGTAIFLYMGMDAPDALLGFGFGGTLLALFMRVGGGIYTKAADVGADLVGKVEAGMPEDDPRNAAVIADLVGDNVGDCAGMAADIFESYEVTIVSGLILGVALVMATNDLKWIIFPLLVRGIGVLSSIFGTYLVRGKKGGGSENALNLITGASTPARRSPLSRSLPWPFFTCTSGAPSLPWPSASRLPFRWTSSPSTSRTRTTSRSRILQGPPARVPPRSSSAVLWSASRPPSGRPLSSGSRSLPRSSFTGARTSLTFSTAWR
jgi:K(+)-stimulated pyrophosphate-energized sodium pump